MYIGSRPNAPHGTATNNDHPCHPVAASNSKQPPATDAQDTKLDRILRTTSASPPPPPHPTLRPPPAPPPPPPPAAGCTPSRCGRVGRRSRPPPTSNGLRGAGREGGGGNREARAAAPAEGRRDRYMVAVRASSARRNASAVGQRSSGSFSSERITHAARSSGQSLHRSVTSGARSVMCFMRMPGTVGAWNGSSPVSI